MSLLMSASPWTNEGSSNKKRSSTMRKTVKLRPTESESDEYLGDESTGDLSNQLPPTVQDIQSMNETRNNKVTDLINKLTTLNENNDGERLANFVPISNPEVISKKPPLENRNSGLELAASEFNPQNPYQSSPPAIVRPGGAYAANDNNLGKLTNYRMGYNPPEISNQPYYAKMGIGSTNGNGDDKLIEKINYMIHLLEEQQSERTQNVMEEFILYTFLGVFVIYIADSFVRVGKYVR